MAIFHCLSAFCSIKFFRYFSLYCLFLYYFWSLFKMFYLKRFLWFLNKTVLRLPPGFWLSTKIILMYYIEGVCTNEYSWRLILFLSTWCTSSILLCILKNEFSKPIFKNKLSFISWQLNKKISLIKLFPVRGKQENASSNNFTTQTQNVLKWFFVMYIMPKHIRQLVVALLV